MNRSSIPELLEDLDDVIERIRDAGLPVGALERARRSLPELRTSQPPASIHAANQPVRTGAQRAFRNAREIARRIRGDQ